MPTIRVLNAGERARFLPGGKGLVYMQGLLPPQDFWLLDLATKKARPLTHLNNRMAMRTFDVTPDAPVLGNDRMASRSCSTGCASTRVSC